jgi:chemotaxis signal transduction protein
MSKLVLFKSGDVLFAIGRAYIAHIAPMTADAMPAWHCSQRATLPFKGEFLPIIDLAAATKSERCASNPSEPKAIVIGATPNLALWADHVNGLLSADIGEEVDLPQIYHGTARECFPTVLRIKNHIALIVRVDSLPALLEVSKRSSRCSDADSFPITSI